MKDENICIELFPNQNKSMVFNEVVLSMSGKYRGGYIVILKMLSTVKKVFFFLELRN